MKPIKLISFMFLALFFSFSIFANNPNEERIARLHQLILIDDETEVEYTSITHYKLKDNSLDFVDTTVLLDLGDAGKWIYKYSVEYFRPQIPRFRKESFKQIDTKEEVTVSYIFAQEKYEIVKYILGASHSNKSLVINSNQVQDDPKDFIPFVKENFSQKFIMGLAKIRKIVFLLYNSNWDTISLMPFRVLWGLCPETKDLFKSKNLLAKLNDDFSDSKKCITLYANCDFDAKFGYPCSPEEVPSINPKILVIEKKQ